MKIICDSGTDKAAEMMGGDLFEFVPLSLTVDDVEYSDDDKLDIDGYIAAMESARRSIHTAAPSPQAFLDRLKKDGSNFVVTISSKLSATYQNALLAKELCMDEAKDKAVHVIDSLSASCGETLIALKIKEMLANGMKEQDVAVKAHEFVQNLKTFFVLERYDFLVKSGRMSSLLARAAGILSVRPICQAKDGEIAVVDKQRGSKRALERLSEIIAETVVREKIDAASRILAISHVKAPERAREVKDAILAKTRFKDSMILETSGLCSTYAQRGGVILAF